MIENAFFVNVKDYGATGDGVTDDAAAIQSALDDIQAAGAGTLYFPTGVYASTATFNIDFPVTIVGQGDGYDAWTTFPTTVGSTLKYIGPTGSDEEFFVFTEVNFGGVGMKNIRLEAGTLANKALVLNSVVGGLWENITIDYFANVGIYLKADTGTCSWNTFTNIAINCFGNKACIWLSGTPNGANACHNSFNNLRLAYGDTGIGHGIYLGNCDNNTFVMTFIFDSGTPSGYGVYVDPTESNLFPINNHFFHLQASTKGWFQPSTTQNSPASIFGYAQDNGQPPPITNGTFLNVIYSDRGNIVGSSGFSLGLSVGKNFVGQVPIAAGVTQQLVTFPNGAEPNANYLIFLSPVFGNPGTNYYSFDYTAASFKIQLVVAQPGTVFFNYLVIRT
jgi:hypothetical protein